MTIEHILYGTAVSDHILQTAKELSDRLILKGITPTLAIIRVGSRKDDISYEKTAEKKAARAGIKLLNFIFDEDISKFEFEKELDQINKNKNIHGILVFNPLPPQLDLQSAKSFISPEKDVDGLTDTSSSFVYTGKGRGFAPCTACAVIEMLDFYGIDVDGKNIAVLGRSIVIGKPVAMLLMQKNATVVNLHTHTKNAHIIASKADILIAAMGRLKAVGEEFTNDNQIIIDVGINWDPEKGSIAGDVDFENVENKVFAISPVPRGVGAVTSSVLMKHVVEACILQTEAGHE